MRRQLTAMKSRNPARDMWSLACVSFEMSTVLMNHTIQDLRQLYGEKWHPGHCIRDKLPGTKLWVEKMKPSASIKEDHQALDLGRLRTVLNR